MAPAWFGAGGLLTQTRSPHIPRLAYSALSGLLAARLACRSFRLRAFQACCRSFSLPPDLLTALLSLLPPFRLTALFLFQALTTFSTHRSFRFRFFTGERASTVGSLGRVRPRGTQVPGSVQGDFPHRPDPHTSPGLQLLFFLLLFFLLFL